ncbi:DUF3509 domain-containing protein [Azomonas macrocytogenes]|uniref:DUF3509 domain-containing protein n=1 Tax=Azomonas macrocytogenes TaxID=69962 RepID=A0A839SZF9_AZOMA|nr:DUF3509 domain-containing protein [Azomonas macrocytogenes]MBB3102721.1 hypothetical protein [Azomonas macrocytogenes]
MSLAQDFLATAFPEFDVATVARPDGGVLVTLNADGQDVLRRALSRGQAQSHLQLEWLVSSIRRDLALEAGTSPAIAHLQSQSRVALPKYEYA